MVIQGMARIAVGREVIPTLLAAMLWLWDLPCGEPIQYFRVEQVHIYQIGIQVGHDELGNPIPMPIYIPWYPVLIQESLETSVLIMCEPLAGELCAIIVTSVDYADNPDDGAECLMSSSKRY